MILSPTSPQKIRREFWFRRGTPTSSNTRGTTSSILLPELGVAAARETLVTAALPFAAAWTGLFRELIADGQELRWRENGPGIGRDARIAYSGLFGRFMARAYLTANEGVRILVPLDVAKRVLQGTSYSVAKYPPGGGLEADWIGLDNRRRLVIAEAKGSFDKGVRTWSGPHHIPGTLKTAVNQAQRTNVFRKSASRPLPAKRWAIASRWANEDNELRPTLLAWDPDEEELDKHDYQVFAKLLHRADVTAILRALGHPVASEVLDIPEPIDRFPGDMHLRIGKRLIDPGFASVFGPIGIYPLRERSDLDQLRRIRERTPMIAVVSLSTRYISMMAEDPPPLHGSLSDDLHVSTADNERIAIDSGLTVVWPTRDQGILPVDD